MRVKISWKGSSFQKTRQFWNSSLCPFRAFPGESRISQRQNPSLRSDRKYSWLYCKPYHQKVGCSNLPTIDYRKYEVIEQMSSYLW